MRRTLYGWRLNDGRFCLSRLPPDQPQVPLHTYPSLIEAEQAALVDHDGHALRKPPNIVWSGSALAEKRILSERTRLRHGPDCIT